MPEDLRPGPLALFAMRDCRAGVQLRQLFPGLICYQRNGRFRATYGNISTQAS